MKLSTHYNKASIFVSIAILIVSGVLYYLIINYIARQQLDRDLGEEVEEVVKYVNIHQKLPTPIEFDEDVTTYEKTTKTDFEPQFFDTPFKNLNEKKVEPGRALSVMMKVADDRYIVTIVESRESAEYLIQVVFLITTVLTALLLFVLAIINRFVLRDLWRPFYHILNQVTIFNVASTKVIDNVPSKVDEFHDLSDAVSKMSSRVLSDYMGLKSFTENASHEMMTPLAVITSKLDVLIQDETLKHEQLSQITDIYGAANKLARLNQSLLLLVKIDNDLIKNKEHLSIQALIFEKARQLAELINNKKIDLQLTLENLDVNASRYLMEILVNNLFSNAIRHNTTGGQIKIEIKGRQLLFQNSGEHGCLNEEMIFKRFYKGTLSDGTGLGLSIIENICSLYDFKVVYRYAGNLHQFQLTF